MAFRIALTFDAEHPDRPHRPGATERVIDLLAERGVAASFFIQGRWAEAQPRLARRIAEAGHQIGNHSHYHARMPQLTAAGLAFDVRAAERAIIVATGIDPRPWFRCPYGAGTDDPIVLAALERMGYRETRWDVECEDWRPSRTGRDLAERMTAGTVARGDGAVLLLHPWTIATGAGLPLLIDRLRDRGASFVRLDALA